MISLRCRVLGSPELHRVPRRETCGPGAGLFSATQTEAVEALARAGLRNPVRVAVAVAPTGGAGVGADAAPAAADGQRTPSSLRIAYRTCQPEQKLGQLLHFLQARRGAGLRSEGGATVCSGRASCAAHAAACLMELYSGNS
jgi:superfamily II DNA/RNA helicase